MHDLQFYHMPVLEAILGVVGIILAEFLHF
jgi:hypothetical protein